MSTTKKKKREYKFEHLWKVLKNTLNGRIEDDEKNLKGINGLEAYRNVLVMMDFAEVV